MSGARPGRAGRIYPGWWVVWASSGIQVLVGGLLMQAFGVYMVALTREFGWSSTMLSAGFSMYRLEGGVLAPVQGKLLDVVGPRTVIRVGLVVCGVGFMLFSRVQTPVQFFLSFFVMALGASLAGYLSISVSVVEWFERRRGLALGLAHTGSSIGGLLVPAVTASFLLVGWRGTAFASGVLIVVAGLFLAAHIKPGPKRPQRARERAADPPEDATPDPPVTEMPVRIDYSARQALATRAFWFISFGHMTSVLIVSAVVVHLVAHLIYSMGYALDEAARVVALMTFMQLVGMVLGGMLGDRHSKRAIVIVCMWMHGAGMLALTYATSGWMVGLFAMLHGLAWGTRGPMIQALRADYFGVASFGSIIGLSTMVVMVGHMAGPLIAGAFYDVLGNYRAVFTAFALSAFAGSGFFVLARPPVRERDA